MGKVVGIGIASIKGSVIQNVNAVEAVKDKGLCFQIIFMYCNSNDIRGVAQPGSASGLGPEGRRFKSCRPAQH